MLGLKCHQGSQQAGQLEQHTLPLVSVEQGVSQEHGEEMRGMPAAWAARPSSIVSFGAGMAGMHGGAFASGQQRIACTAAEG